MQKPCCFSPGRSKDIRTECENICVLFPFVLQTFHTPSLGDEEFEIPPITPPPESDPALGIPDVLLPFQGLSDPLPSQGSEFTPQFPPQSLDLPSITISRNLVEQDGVLHNSGSHMVGSKLIAWMVFFILCATPGEALRSMFCLLGGRVDCFSFCRVNTKTRSISGIGKRARGWLIVTEESGHSHRIFLI